MASFIHPIDWLSQTVNLWLDRLQDRHAPAHHDLAEDVAAEDVYHEFNTQLWFLPPPC